MCCGTPNTDGKCGGGSMEAEVVKEDSGNVELGVLDNRSVYDMNDNLLV